jgi:hypothetical protein
MVTPVVVIVAFASGNCSLPTIQNYHTNVFDFAFIYRQCKNNSVSKGCLRVIGFSKSSNITDDSVLIYVLSAFMTQSCL